MKAHLLSALIVLLSISTSQAQNCCQGFEASFSFSYAANPLGVEFDNNASGEWDIAIWHFGDGTTSNDANPNHVFAEPGLYQVCLVIESNDDCRSELCRDVAVGLTHNPCGDFLANFSTNPMANPLGVEFDNNATGDWSFIVWHFGDGTSSNNTNPEHIYNEAGVYQVCMVIEGDQNGAGCRSERCREVAVNLQDNPCQGFEAAFGYDHASNNPLGVIFDNNSAGEADDIIWNFGDGSSSNEPNPDHAYAEPGVYQVCLVIESDGGCRSEICKEVAVGLMPNPCNDFLADFTTSPMANPLGVEFDNNATGDWSFIVWHFGDGTTSNNANPEHIYAESGVYQVCMVIEGDQNGEGCRSERCREVAVNLQGNPCSGFEADFGYDHASNNPLAVIFDNGSAGEVDDVIWHFGDGSTSNQSNPDHVYAEPGVYQVCLVVETDGGCRSELCKEVAVGLMPNPCNDFLADFSTNPMANPLGVEFDNNATGDWSFIVWHFGDGTSSNNANPDHIYAEAGVYQVCMVIEGQGDCRSEWCQNVAVGSQENPCQGFEADFSYEHANNNPLGVIFDNNSVGEADDVIWHFGDGSTSNESNPDHAYAEPGVYQVCLVIESDGGCRSEICKEVAVNVLSEQCHDFIADFSHQVNLENLTAHFTDISSSDAQFHIWHFGDGGTSNLANPSHQYSEPGIYQVCLVIEENECRSEYCREVCIEDQNPCDDFGAEFTYTVSQNNPLRVEFDGDYSGDFDFIVWHFGDGHSSDAQNPNHEFAEPGNYVVCVVIESNSGCRSEYCITVSVGQEENPCEEFEAHFSYFVDLVEGGVSFQNLSVGDIDSYSWSFGSDDENPSFEFNQTGLHNVCLVIENEQGCQAEYCQMIHVPAYYFYVVQPTSIVDAETENNLLVYPNPFATTIHFGNAANRTVEVFNLQGRSVISEMVTGTSMELSQLPSGLYLMRIAVKGEEPRTVRMVKQ